MVLDRFRARRKRMSIEQHLALSLSGQPFKAQIRPIEHHLAHLASAYTHLASTGPWPCRWTALVTLPAPPGVGIGGRIAADGKVDSRTPGRFLSGAHPVPGLPHYGDEYKVMGLAPMEDLCTWRRCERWFRPVVASVSPDTRYFDTTASALPTIGKTALPVSIGCIRANWKHFSTGLRTCSPLSNVTRSGAIGAGRVRRVLPANDQRLGWRERDRRPGSRRWMRKTRWPTV